MTRKMIAAATALDKAMPSPLPSEAAYFTAIYSLMAALAPAAHRDAGEAEARDWQKLALRMENERDAALAQLAALTDHADAQKELLSMSRATIAARDARIAELDTMLAQRAAVVSDTPNPTPNPFRDFPVDQRRIGG